MALGDLAADDAVADLGFQLEQPERVGNRHPVLADAAGDFVLGVAVLLDQPAVGRGLLDGIKVRALDVFDKRQFQQLDIRRLADDDRDGCQPGQPRGLQPALPGDELVTARSVAGDDQRLDDAVLADRSASSLISSE
jgi:hypothetical protein